MNKTDIEKLLQQVLERFDRLEKIFNKSPEYRFNEVPMTLDGERLLMIIATCADY